MTPLLPPVPSSTDASHPSPPFYCCLFLCSFMCLIEVSDYLRHYYYVVSLHYLVLISIPLIEVIYPEVFPEETVLIHTRRRTSYIQRKKTPLPKKKKNN